MPKGLNIENKELLLLFQKTVESSLPFSLKINKNFGSFSSLIYDKTGNYISVSTLRRIFQYNSKSMPTLYTMDTICKALDYGNWQAFLDCAYINHEEEHYEILSSLRYNGYENTEEFMRIFNDFVYTDFKYDITLALIKAAVRKADIPVLSTIFELPVVFDAPFSERKMRRHLYFTEEIGMIFRNDKQLIQKLIPYYAKSKYAQINYIERFVDEEELNGYFGDMLEVYHKHKTTLEATLFYHSLMCQRDFNNGDYESEHLPFLINFKETEPVYFIPKIRRIALLIVHYYATDKAKVEELLSEIPNTIHPEFENCNTYCAFNFSKLVFPLRDHTLIKRYLTYFNQSTDKHYSNVYAKRNMNLLKIYEAYLLCCDGSPDLADQKLNSYNHLYSFPNSQKLTNTHIDIIRRLIQSEKRKQQLQ
ncbi:MAG: hypothetical protein ACOYMA_18890 [Bacteroidia bacterium]